MAFVSCGRSFSTTVGEEHGASGARVHRDIIKRVANVFEVDAIVFHKDVASARIRCWR